MRADKRLGQHFLRDIEVLEEIVAIADVSNSAGVLEIGPGEGALTAFLVRAGRPVVALERDPRAVKAVEERLGDKVEIVEGDALEEDLGALLPPAIEGRDAPVIVGNLPYNVGTAIYRRILALRKRSSRAVLMLSLRSQSESWLSPRRAPTGRSPRSRRSRPALGSCESCRHAPSGPHPRWTRGSSSWSHSRSLCWPPRRSRDS